MRPAPILTAAEEVAYRAELERQMRPPPVTSPVDHIENPPGFEPVVVGARPALRPPAPAAAVFYCHGCGVVTAERYRPHDENTPACAACRNAVARALLHSVCRAGCDDCQVWRRVVGTMPPAPQVIAQPSAPADDRAELVRLACVELAAYLGLRWAVRLLATVTATPASERTSLWTDIAQGVARSSRGDFNRNDFDSLARAARAMSNAADGTGDVDEAAAMLAYTEDGDLTVQRWYAQERGARAGG